MKRGKRAQFFILAAVIISAVIITLGLTTNYVRVNKEPENFYDFSYEVKKESGNVLDYQIYSDFENDANLENFVDLLAKDIRDKDPDANFIFIYGTSDVMNVRNYGAESVGAGDEEVAGGGEVFESQISFFSGGTYVSTSTDGTYDQYGDFWTQEIIPTKDSFEVEIRGQIHEFPISEHKQVIFIMQKDVEDETFIAVE